jgi:hypothetical protein
MYESTPDAPDMKITLAGDAGIPVETACADIAASAKDVANAILETFINISFLD